MAFIDARLNRNYMYGFQGGPRWNTLSTDLRSGRQIRIKRWSMPKHSYTANYAALSDVEKNEMLGAFMAAGGSFASFRFRDFNDYRAIAQTIGVGDGTSEPIQLVRNYQFGTTTFTRPITLPLGAVIRDSDNNIVAATVNPLTGLATPDAPWPNGKVLRWDGEFDVRVHFSADFNPLTAVGGGVRECMVEIEEDWG